MFLTDSNSYKPGPAQTWHIYTKSAPRARSPPGPARTPKAFLTISEVQNNNNKKIQSELAPLAKNTAHPKSFAAKSIIIITCGDEFPMMVAGPQQPPLIMTFCSCWQSLPVRWLTPNSQRVRQSTHTHTHNPGLGLAARNVGTTGMALERQTSFVGRPQRSLESACSFQFNHL